MVASKACFIIFYFILNISNAKERDFQIHIEVNCGNLPFSGTVLFCNDGKQELAKWNLNRATLIEHAGRYEASRGNYYFINIRTDCGVISPIGSFCQNEFTLTLEDYKRQGRLEWQPLNFWEEVRKIVTKTGDMVLKCDEELKTFTCQ